MNLFLTEPLLHFLILGTALFALFQSMNADPIVDTNNCIVVSAGRIEQLRQVFATTRQRDRGGTAGPGAYVGSQPPVAVGLTGLANTGQRMLVIDAGANILIRRERPMQVGHGSNDPESHALPGGSGFIVSVGPELEDVLPKAFAAREACGRRR